MSGARSQQGDPAARGEGPQPVQPPARPDQGHGQRAGELDGDRNPKRDTGYGLVEAQVHGRQNQPEDDGHGTVGARGTTGHGTTAGGPGAQHQSHQDGGGDDQAQGRRPRRPDPPEQFGGQGRSELDRDGTPSDQDNGRGTLQGPVRGHRPIVG